jgi:outer membrane biosynthesis protein TonB
LGFGNLTPRRLLSIVVWSCIQLLMPTKLQSAIKSLVDKYGIVEASKKIGVTTVSLQAFLHNSEVYAKTLAKMQKAAGVEVTAISAKEKAKATAAEKRAARKAKKEAREEAKSKKVAKKEAAKPKRTKGKVKVRMKPKKVKAAPRKTKVKKKPKSRKPMAPKKPKKSKPTSNGVSGPSLPVAADEDDDELVAAAQAGE